MLHVVIQTYTSPCPMSRVFYWVGVANLVIFMWLFMDFYKKNYLTPKHAASPVCTRQVTD